MGQGPVHLDLRVHVPGHGLQEDQALGLDNLLDPGDGLGQERAAQRPHGPGDHEAEGVGPRQGDGACAQAGGPPQALGRGEHMCARAVADAGASVQGIGHGGLAHAGGLGHVRDGHVAAGRVPPSQSARALPRHRCHQLMVSVPGSRRSADDPEPSGPADLLGGNEGELQEAHGLELMGPLQGARVDDPVAGGLDRADERRLRLLIVPATSTVVGSSPTFPLTRAAVNVVLKAFSTVAPGDLLLDLGSRGGAGEDHQLVEGREVQRVGNVHHDQAVPPTRVRLEHVVDRRVGGRPGTPPRCRAGRCPPRRGR